MVSCVLAIFTIDRFGRRKVLMVGGALSKVGADQRSASIGAAAGSFVFVYNFVFAVCAPIVLYQALISRSQLG
jgi:hypothetical protein